MVFRKYSLYDTTQEEWQWILDLAHRWKFAEVKNLVVRELQKMEISPVDRIQLYHHYEVDKNYLITSYTALSTRDAPLNRFEGEKLGLDTVLTIAAARERVRSRPSSGGLFSPMPADVTEEEVEPIIKEVFGVPPPASESKDEVVNGESNLNSGSSTTTGGSVMYLNVWL
jgi:hypothetical protein